MGTLDFARRVVVAVTAGLLIVGAGYLVFRLAGYLLIIFAGVLLAVVLHTSAVYLSHRLPVPRVVALIGVILGSVSFLVAGSWLAGPPIVRQTQQLTSRIPETVEDLRADIEASEWGQTLTGLLGTDGAGLPEGANVLGRITGVFSTAFMAIVNVIVILFVGLYLAADPRPYVRSLVTLFPQGQRVQVAETMGQLRRALAWWTVGRLASMAIVGALTYVGLLIVGAPLPLALAFIAGLLSFVPILGPILAAIPAVLLAWGENFAMAVTVTIVYVVVQSIESYIVTPLIEREVVSLPPAAVLVGQVLIGSLAGMVGLFLSTPLIVAFTVLVQKLYLEQVLQEPVRVLGDR